MFSVAARGFAHFRTIRSEHGRSAALEWLIDRVGARLVNLGVSEVVWLEPGKVKLVGAPPDGFEYRFLKANELASFLGAENELDERHVVRLAAGNDLCFAVLKEGRLAAYGWYALRCIEGEHCDGVSLSFPPSVAYMYKGFTHPDFRGLRLHGFAMRLALERLAEERGVNALVSTVSWLNWPSLKSCERLGYQQLGRMVSIGWSWCGLGFYPRQAVQRGIRFGRRADLSSRRQKR